MRSAAEFIRCLEIKIISLNSFSGQFSHYFPPNVVRILMKKWLNAMVCRTAVPTGA